MVAPPYAAGNWDRAAQGGKSKNLRVGRGYRVYFNAVAAKSAKSMGYYASGCKSCSIVSALKSCPFGQQIPQKLMRTR